MVPLSRDCISLSNNSHIYRIFDFRRFNAIMIAADQFPRFIFDRFYVHNLVVQSLIAFTDQAIAMISRQTFSLSKQ